MLKQLIQLLVNQLVPKRAVSGGGSKLIYGKEAEQFGLPVWPSPTVINLPDEPENLLLTLRQHHVWFAYMWKIRLVL